MIHCETLIQLALLFPSFTLLSPSFCRLFFLSLVSRREMRERCLARCLFFAFVLVTQVSVGFIQCHRCNHYKYQSASNSLKRPTRSAPAVAAVVATAAAAVSAAGNAPDWTSEENEIENEETIQARLEYIKQQILRRLGLTNAPRIKKHIDISNCK